MLEALLCSKWEAFCQWAAQEREQIDTTNVDEALEECNLAIEKEDMQLLGRYVTEYVQRDRSF